MKILIFTDLDGTLLNHADYSFQDALPALKRIRAGKVPLILVTSKTRKEVEILRRELGIHDPFITENGGGIFFDRTLMQLAPEESFCENGYYLIRLGVPYAEIRSFFLGVRDRFHLRGFGDMNIGEVMELTGLPRDRAVLALQREFTEPFIIPETEDIAALTASASLAGLKITRGGRFYHLIGNNQDKGRAVATTIRIFKKNSPDDTIVTIGLGDSQNDIPLLENVDYPVLIPKPGGQYEELSLTGLIEAPCPGSRGWNESLHNLLDTIKSDKTL